MLGNRYENLHDPTDLHDARAFASGKCVAKFCSMGYVTSKKWFGCYITIIDGLLRLYDDEKTCQENPSNTVLTIPLDQNHATSSWKRKNYSQDPDKVIDFYCFYVIQNKDKFYQTRQLKIGCWNIEFAETLIRAIEFNTKNKTTP